MKNTFLKISIILILTLSCIMGFVITSYAEEKTVDVFNISEKQHMMVNVLYTNGVPSVKFIAPNGSEYADNAISEGKMRKENDGSAVVFYIPNAMPGQWKMVYDQGANTELEITWAPYGEEISITEFSYEKDGSDNLSVTFNATYGTLTGNTSQTVSSGGKVVQPSNPIHNKYNFTGWYTDSSCTNLYDFSLPVTTSFTLYAGWKSLEKYISYLFDSLEGEGPHDVILKGEFTDEIMDLLVAKIKESSVKVNLDLKNTTGLVVIDDFHGCNGLTSIKIPSTVTSIGARAFSTTGLTSVYIPDSVTAIGPAAFFACSKLTSLEIPLSVTTIGSEAFRMTGLTSIDIPASVKSIGQFAFDDCKKLISINIPTSVTTIDAGAFAGCSELKSIEIPSSLKIIESGVFFKCTGLTTVEIPTSVTQIEPNAFYGCTGLTSITFKDTSTWYYSSSSIKIDGSSISVTSSSTNVINLIDTYASYYWHKE